VQLLATRPYTPGSRPIGRLPMCSIQSMHLRTAKGLHYSTMQMTTPSVGKPFVFVWLSFLTAASHLVHSGSVANVHDHLVDGTVLRGKACGCWGVHLCPPMCVCVCVCVCDKGGQKRRGIPLVWFKLLRICAWDGCCLRENTCFSRRHLGEVWQEKAIPDMWHIILNPFS